MSEKSILKMLRRKNLRNSQSSTYPAIMLFLLLRSHSLLFQFGDSSFALADLFGQSFRFLFIDRFHQPSIPYIEVKFAAVLIGVFCLIEGVNFRSAGGQFLFY